MGTGQAEGVGKWGPGEPPQKDNDPAPGTHGRCTQATKFLLLFNSPVCPGQEKNFLSVTLTRFFNILGRKVQSSAWFSTPPPRDSEFSSSLAANLISLPALTTRNLRTTPVYPHSSGLDS